MKRLIVLVFFGLTNNVFGQLDIKEVGIPDDKFYAHAQEKSNWCWAASIQMVLEHCKIFKSQKEIVDWTLGAEDNGELPNLGGTVQMISDNLNNWEVDMLHRNIEIKSAFFSHPPSPKELVYYLKNNQPIYISYKSSLSTNHAIVITSCRYTEVNGVYEIIDFTARDPWPSPENVDSEGLVVYKYSSFYPLLNYFWIVSSRLKGHFMVSLDVIKNCDLPFCESLNKILDDYDNNFDKFKGKSITAQLFRSNFIFPNEEKSFVGKYTALDGTVYPRYSVTFRASANRDSSLLAYEDLKSNFKQLDIYLEENTKSKYNKYESENKAIFMEIGDGKVIELSWMYNKFMSKYITKMVIQSQIEVKQFYK